MLNIRNYKYTDYPVLKAWWEANNEAAPTLSLMPLESTFVAEWEGKPLLSVTLYLTNCKEIAFVENFIGDPEAKGPLRKEAGQVLQRYIEKWAKAAGYNRLMCTLLTEPLKPRYEELGYKTGVSGVSLMVKEI